MEIENLRHNFTYHPPKGGQPEKYRMIRVGALELAEELNELCPDSREKAIAFEHLETAVFWANAAIARNSQVCGDEIFFYEKGTYGRYR